MNLENIDFNSAAYAINQDGSYLHFSDGLWGLYDFGESPDNPVVPYIFPNSKPVNPLVLQRYGLEYQSLLNSPLLTSFISLYNLVPCLKMTQYSISILINEDQLRDTYMEAHSLSKEDFPSIEQMILSELEWIAPSGISIIGHLIKEKSEDSC